VLFPTPKTRVLELTSPVTYRAGLTEPPLPEDSTSGQTAEQLPLYNCYSCDGDVAGQLVYVNYGVPKDYEELDRRGIDVRVRSSLPGMVAHGGDQAEGRRRARGHRLHHLFRSAGRRIFRRDVYPGGIPERVRRAARIGGRHAAVSGGSAHAVRGATKNAKRLPLNEARTLTSIPVLPISYGDALPLLRALADPLPRRSGAGHSRSHITAARDRRRSTSNLSSHGHRADPGRHCHAEREQ